MARSSNRAAISPKRRAIGSKVSAKDFKRGLGQGRAAERDHGGFPYAEGWRQKAAQAWIVFKITDVTVPPVDMASDDVKKLQQSLQRGLADEQVSQYVNQIEKVIGTTINQAAFAQVTGANNN